QAQALSRPWFFPFLAPLRWAPCNKATLYGEMLRIQEIRSIAFIYSPLVHQQVTHRHANDRALWLLEVTGHVGPHRGAVDRAVGGAARWRQNLLARRPAAGAGPLRRGWRRLVRRQCHRPDAEALQRAHPRARIRRRLVDGGGRR